VRLAFGVDRKTICTGCENKNTRRNPGTFCREIVTARNPALDQRFRGLYEHQYNTQSSPEVTFGGKNLIDGK
jgi:hypothetical protein